MNCQQIQKRLSDFVDERLAARDTWEVDRHLADCTTCTAMVNDLRKTVHALRSVPEIAVSDDFMASLNARLAKVEPKPARLSVLTNLAQMFRPRMLPAWGAAAACGLAMIIFVSRPGMVPTPVVNAPASKVAAQGVQSHAAAVVSDPFEDVAAANLAQSTDSSSSGATL